MSISGKQVALIMGLCVLGLLFPNAFVGVCLLCAAVGAFVSVTLA